MEKWVEITISIHTKLVVWVPVPKIKAIN